jgi:hypothetical protein
MSSELDILTWLNEALRAPRAATYLTALAREITSVLNSEPAARLAWRSIQLDAYDRLPEGIASSWIFALKAGCSSGAERHPNSIQRVMSFRGSADMQIWGGQGWMSNVLNSDPAEPLERRWLSIPRSVWHRPVMRDEDWVVVSFHTASDRELIEELPIDDENPDLGSKTARLYAGREAR